MYTVLFRCLSLEDIIIQDIQINNLQIKIIHVNGRKYSFFFSDNIQNLPFLSAVTVESLIYSIKLLSRSECCAVITFQ